MHDVLRDYVRELADDEGDVWRRAHPKMRRRELSRRTVQRTALAG
jgi:hypothetical protein